MKEPLHCKPQTEDGKKFLDDNAQSESYDSTMEKQAKLFCNADGGPQDSIPNRPKTKYLIPVLHHHYLIPSFGPHLMDVYYLFLISNILHVFCSLLVSPCNFQTFLPISSDKTHTKLETKNFAVWRKLHSSHIGTWNHMCEFYMHYQHHPRIIFLLLI